ncbi:unnamed protein product [Rotaria sp. Silwood1]|nr:unnamed protein product [Rotaria sp. Silwood1]
MRCLDTLAAYYVKRNHCEKAKDKKREYFTPSTLLYMLVDKILVYDLNHLLHRAYIYYRQTLNSYKRASKYASGNSADIRVGLANAFVQLYKLENTELAFNRTIEIDP